MGYKVAVAGATGNVGREMLAILAERNFPADEVVALASRRSVGTECSFGDKTLKVKGGFFAGKSFDAKQIEALSELPPRDVLLAQVIGAIASPLSGLVGTIEALYADPIRVIGAVADKVGEGAPAPAPKAEEAAPATAEEAPAAEAEAAPAPEASVEEAPAADAEPEAATPATDEPAETSADTDSTEAAAEAAPTDNPATDPTE